MFKLPVCPHCGTVYRYKDVRKVWGEDIRNTYRTMDHNKAHKHTCYHCHKEFRASGFPGIIVLILLWIIVNMGTLLLMLSRMTQLNIVLMFTVTLVYMALVVVLLPFFVTFRKIEKKKEK